MTDTGSHHALTWFSRPPGKLVDSASLTRLDTLLVARPPRPKMPELRLFAVLRELLALVVEAAEEPVCPVALRRATAAKVSRSDTAEESRVGSESWRSGQRGESWSGSWALTSVEI